MSNRTAPAVMVQGTGSDVGKSFLVAALGRAFACRGLRVRPFKAQNMSNNAAAVEGGEIGRAQWVQARACFAVPTTDMNPVLLKPETDTGAQVVVQGRVLGNYAARNYQTYKPNLMPAVLESFARLAADADLILVEGAGSPAEINLRGGDIANMGFAEAADLPVILVADIERGGSIAAIVGTCAVLPPAERARIKGFVVNRFRGDMTLFHDGMRMIAERTGLQGLGILPFLPEARLLPGEDSIPAELVGAPRRGSFHVAVPMLSRISNTDDVDPLRAEARVSVTMVPPGRPIPADVDLILLPGSKSTLGDLAFLRAQGWDIDLLAHVRRGGYVLGICGGYQMLGREISDPMGIEGPPATASGLGLLDVRTILHAEKLVRPVTGRATAENLPIAGYEIHAGRTDGPDCARPMLRLDAAAGGERADGATRPDGRVAGCYIHGLFTANPFRRAFLERLQAKTGRGGGAGFGMAVDYDASVEAALDAMAAHVERHLDLERILAFARARAVR